MAIIRRKRAAKKTVTKVERPKETTPEEAPKPKVVVGVRDGDVYTHFTSRNKHYCILIADELIVKYASLSSHSWAGFKAKNHEVMLQGAKIMPKSEADAWVKNKKWELQGNIVKSWGG